MGADGEEQEMLIQLAELRQQMSAMCDSVDEIKLSVREVIKLDRTIAELSIHREQQAGEIKTQWAKIDANHIDIEKVDRKADEWINKGRGAWFMAMLMGGLAQLAVLTMIAWVFTHVRAAEDTLLLLNQKVEQRLHQ